MRRGQSRSGLRKPPRPTPPWPFGCSVEPTSTSSAPTTSVRASPSTTPTPASLRRTRRRSSRSMQPWRPGSIRSQRRRPRPTPLRSRPTRSSLMRAMRTTSVLRHSKSSRPPMRSRVSRRTSSGARSSSATRRPPAPIAVPAATPMAGASTAHPTMCSRRTAATARFPSSPTGTSPLEASSAPT